MSSVVQLPALSTLPENLAEIFIKTAKLFIMIVLLLSKTTDDIASV